MTRLAVSAVATSICSMENAFFSLIALVDRAIFSICRSGCRRVSGEGWRDTRLYLAERIFRYAKTRS